MAIPDFQTLMKPVLLCLADGDEHTLAELRDRIAAQLHVTPEDLLEKLPSGRQTVFGNRVAWSTVYLAKAKAVDRPRRGVFKITDRGRELLSLNTPGVSVKDLLRYPEFVDFYKGTGDVGNGRDATSAAAEQTPEEQLENAYTALRDSLANEVLEAARKASPKFFEELVIDVLVAMGYGGSVEEAGKAVGRSGDGGIDGIIREDKLGLDIVCVQAKRWSEPVGRPVVQAFAGSLEGARARKGVLITTSTFSRDALDYVKAIEKRIVLIDGKQLAYLMIDHDVGVNVVRTYKVKRLDSDYFEEA